MRAVRAYLADTLRKILRTGDSMPAGRRIGTVAATTATALALSTAAFAGTASADTGCTTANGQELLSAVCVNPHPKLVQGPTWPRGSRVILTCAAGIAFSPENPVGALAGCGAGEVIGRYVHD